MPDPRTDDAGVHQNPGVGTVSQGKLDAAVMAFQWEVALHPEDVQLQQRLGRALILQGKLDEAVSCCERAVALDPHSAEPQLLLSTALRQQGKLDQAATACRRAIELEPDNPNPHIMLSSLLRMQGRFPEGWDELEWRLRLSPQNVPETLWQGESLYGRTLLIWAEQGLGDSIQFSRYINLVRPAAGRILVEVQEPLLKLFQGSFEHKVVFAQGQERPPFDFHVPFLSLPRLLGTNLNSVPADIPYLRPDPLLVKDWEQRLEPYGSLKVGIVWAGNPMHPWDFARSMAFATFRQALLVPGLRIFSLQVGPRASDVHDERELKVVSIPADFADTAAAIMNLDLCITIDSAVAHLAGALGRPVWILTPFAADWRWLLDREDTPWYPTVRLFRQERPNDWTPVLERIRAELERFVAGERRVLLPNGGGGRSAQVAGETADSASVNASSPGHKGHPARNRCKICGAETVALGVVDFNKHCPIPGDVRLPPRGVEVGYQQCTACGFLFTAQFDHWSKAEFLARIYNEGYAQVDPDYADLRPQANAMRVMRHAGSHRERLSCLDYGGGNGKLAGWLFVLGFGRALSYDPFTPGADVLPKERFDLVTCFEVLEHVPAPRRTVAELTDLVAEDGLVMFSTLVQPPDFVKQGLDWWYVAPRNGHISIHSERSLALLWEERGFTISSFDADLHFAWRTAAGTQSEPWHGRPCHEEARGPEKV